MTSPPGRVLGLARDLSGGGGRLLRACRRRGASRATIASRAHVSGAHRAMLRLEIIDPLVLLCCCRDRAASGAGVRAKAGMLDPRLRRGRDRRQHAPVRWGAFAAPSATRYGWRRSDSDALRRHGRAAHDERARRRRFCRGPPVMPAASRGRPARRWRPPPIR